MKVLKRVLALTLTIACTGAFATAQSLRESDWITGTWEGEQQGKFRVPCELRLTYNPSTAPPSISGTGKFHFAEKQVIANGRMEGELKNGEVILKVDYSGGGPLNNKSITFTLTRQKDGSLRGGGHNLWGRWVELFLEKVE